MLLLVGTVRGLQITVTAQEPDLVFFLKKAKKAPCFFFYCKWLRIIIGNGAYCIVTEYNLSSVRGNGTGGPILLAVLLSILFFHPVDIVHKAFIEK